MNKINRLNEISKNTFGTPMKIIKYINSQNVYVQFLDKFKYITKIQYNEFINGNVKNPYDKSVCKHGYFGVGKYKSKINHKITNCYQHWINMIKRCYNQKCLLKDNTYKGCSVCDEWLNFQNFGEWYDKNYYEISNEVMDLDKDILHKGNKIYAPDNCVFVPHSINSLIIKCDKSRGNLPIGVSFHKRDKIYQASCNNMKKEIFLGYYDNKIDAFNVYKKYKEELIKKIADQYKNMIPSNLYCMLYNYSVEITD